MTYNEAKELVDTKAPHKYRTGKKRELLRKFTQALHRGDSTGGTHTIDGLTTKRKLQTVMNWISTTNPTYLMDVLRGIDELKARRDGRSVYVSYDFAPLVDFKPKDPEQLMAEYKKRDAARARKTYAKNKAALELAKKTKIIRKFLNTVATSKADTVPLQAFVKSLLEETK